MIIEDLPAEHQYVFITMMRAAVHFKEMGFGEKFFLNFAKGVWESMEMSELGYLKDVLDSYEPPIA